MTVLFDARYWLYRYLRVQLTVMLFRQVFQKHVLDACIAMF